MKVNVRSINQDTGEESAPQSSDTYDLFNHEEDVERYRAESELRLYGRYYIGGGASALFLLLKA